MTMFGSWSNRSDYTCGLIAALLWPSIRRIAFSLTTAAVAIAPCPNLAAPESLMPPADA
jgi:hypothetical protein